MLVDLLPLVTAFAPPNRLVPHLGADRVSRAALRMDITAPIGAIAGPLRKWQAAVPDGSDVSTPAAGDLLSELPFEVIGKTEAPRALHT
jgi:hypothetical protein